MMSGSFTPDPKKTEKFKQKILASDPLAEFDLGKRWNVLCSRCSKWYAMKVAYDTTWHKEHWENCKVGRVGNQADLSFFGFNARTPKAPTASPLSTTTHKPTTEPLPHPAASNEKPSVNDLSAKLSLDRPICTGITPEINECVTAYLERSGASGRVQKAFKLLHRNYSILHLRTLHRLRSNKLGLCSNMRRSGAMTIFVDSFLFLVQEKS